MIVNSQRQAASFKLQKAHDLMAAYGLQLEAAFRNE
jgi:hypothetical protein